MKPHHSEETRKARALALVRARLKADLDWLRGYPKKWQSGNVDWVFPLRAKEGPERITIDSTVITKASRAIAELPQRFPRALADAVGDVDVWSANMKAAVGWVKQGLRDGRAPRSLFGREARFGNPIAGTAAELVGTEPLLSQLLADLSWYFCSDPSEGAEMLEWVSARRQQIVGVIRIAPRDHDFGALCLRLRALRAEARESRLAVLERLVLDSRAWQGPLLGLYPERLLPMVKAGDVFTLSELDFGRLGVWLSHWTTRLLAEESSARHRALDLFSATYGRLEEPLEHWRIRWGEIQQALDDLRKMAATTGVAWSEWEEAKAKKKLNSIGAVPGQCGALKTGLESIRRLSRCASTAQHRDLVALAVQMPLLNTGLPAAIPALSSEVPDPVLLDWLGVMRRAIKRHPNLADSMPWTIDRPDVLRSREQCDRFFDALALVGPSGDRESEVEFHEWLSVLCSATTDASVAARWFKRLFASNLGEADRPDLDLLSGAARLCLTEPGAFMPILHGLLALPWHDRKLLLSKVGSESLYRQALLDGHGALLCRGLDRADLLNSKVAIGAHIAGESPVKLTGILDCAPELKTVLAELAATTPAAEEVAVRILGPAFRSREEIHRELQVLRDKVRLVEEATALGARIRALEDLLVARPVLSQQRVEKLQAKIAHTTRRIRLERWVDQIDAELRQRLPKLLGLEAIPDDWWQEPILKCLMGIARLPSEFRALARLVLKRRVGQPPWDLRDHDKNARFLAHLRRNGVRIEPWLDGIGSFQHTSPNVGNAVLELENDPLEVLQMGAHFETCLSPGAFNYFSVIVNMTDINKRILYLRNPRGKVLGRCLLGLASGGGLVTFHPYCHASFDFPSMVRDFTEELAGRMGVPVLPDGRVSPLLSSRWYDDGAVDIHGRLQCLAEGSQFRSTLARLPIDEWS
ncbi:MAG: hypothetical protein WBP56_06765 [Polyangia bacterium]